MKNPLAIALAAGLFLLAGAAFGYEGDGTFTLKGPSRSELDLGPVDLGVAGRREYSFKDLPEQAFTFGLRVTAPAGQKLSHLPGATVRMRLLNEREDVLFDVSDELPNWLRAESSREWFLYLRGLGESTDVAARRSTSYRLLFETVRADSTMSKFVVRLIAVGGGQK